MFEKLVIKNFQIHRRVEIDLEQITVLVGTNDVGKSGIIRALGWLCLNDSQGEADIRKGSSGAMVKLILDDGRSIVRKRTADKNLYILDGKKFVAFRTSVPDEIKELLNLEGINFQEQLENHFWLSLPAPQVSRELNQIVNLGVIDRSLSEVASRIRRTRATVEVTEQRLKQAREDRDSLNWVVEADVQLSKLELKKAAH